MKDKIDNCMDKKMTVFDLLDKQLSLSEETIAKTQLKIRINQDLARLTE